MAGRSTEARPDSGSSPAAFFFCATHASKSALETTRTAIGMQERAGLNAITDGEFRRRSWWLELIMNWDGLAADRAGNSDVVWRNQAGVQQAASRLWINGPIRWRDNSHDPARLNCRAGKTQLQGSASNEADPFSLRHHCGLEVAAFHDRDLRNAHVAPKRRVHLIERERLQLGVHLLVPCERTAEGLPRRQQVQDATVARSAAGTGRGR